MYKKKELTAGKTLEDIFFHSDSHEQPSSQAKLKGFTLRIQYDRRFVKDLPLAFYSHLYFFILFIYV